MTDPNRTEAYLRGEPTPDGPNENTSATNAESSEAPARGAPAGPGGDAEAAPTRHDDGENGENGEMSESLGGDEITSDESTAPLEGDGESLSTLDEMLGADLAKLVAERDEYLDSLRRLQADFDNYRKRAMRQQTDVLERAAESLMGQLLPVLDALDLAEAHSDGNDGGAAAALTQIGTLLRDTLSREGLERIDATGVAFDPTVHDGVAHEEGDGSGGAPEIAEVMRAGYRLKGRVLRPAMVKVRG